MTDDVAKLGLSVDSQGLEQGTDKLKEFSETAKAAGNAADDFNEKASSGAEKTGKAHAESAEKIASSSAKAAGSVAKQAGAFDAVNTAVAAMTERQLGAAVVVGALGTAAAVAAVSVGVLAYNWLDAQEKVSRALIGIGARTGESMQSLNRFSVENASATGLSVSQARDVAVEFTKLGDIAVSGLKGLGDAIHGYSILTGQDATKATQTFAKAFSGDLSGALDLAANKYGVVNGEIRAQVSELLKLGDRTGAAQVIINAMSGDNQKAADSVGVLTKAWDFLGNTISRVKNLPAGNQGLDPNQQVAAARENKNAGLSPVGTNPGGYGLLNTGALYEGMDKLQAKADEFNAGNVVKQLNAMSEAGRAAVAPILEDAAQLGKLKDALAALQAARNTPGVKVSGTSEQNDAAETALQNQIALTEEAMGRAVRYNEAVAEIRKSWGDVGVSTALAAQKMENQLPVAQAIGGEEKRRAQELATIADLLDKGLKIEEAMVIAAGQYNLSKAASIAGAQQSTQALKEQNDLAEAGHVSTVGDSAVERAEAEKAALERKAALATEQDYNKVLKDTGDAQEALNHSQQVSRGYEEAIGAAADKVTEAKIAQRNASDAARKAAEQQAIAEVKAAQAAAQAWEQTYTMTSGRGTEASQSGAGGSGDAAAFSFKSSEGYTSTSNAGVAILQSYMMAQNNTKNLTDLADATIGAGKGIDAAIGEAQGKQPQAQQLATTFPGWTPFSYYGLPDKIAKPAISESEIMGTVGTLFDLKNAQTTDNAVKVSNLNEELAWLQGRPETIARDQRIVNLMAAIDQLKKATDSNTAAVQATLNPLYSEGHGALAVGYYKAAGGLDMIAKGPAVGDTIPFHAMVNGGERITITPAGQSSTSNDNSKTTTIIQNFDFRGASTANQRLGLRQYAQGFGRSAAAMGR